MVFKVHVISCEFLVRVGVGVRVCLERICSISRVRVRVRVR